MVISRSQERPSVYHKAGAILHINLYKWSWRRGLSIKWDPDDGQFALFRGGGMEAHARANPDQGYGESEHAHYRPQIPL